MNTELAAAAAALRCGSLRVAASSVNTEKLQRRLPSYLPLILQQSSQSRSD